jgi:hypothetical protein
METTSKDSNKSHVDLPFLLCIGSIGGPQRRLEAIRYDSNKKVRSSPASRLTRIESLTDRLLPNAAMCKRLAAPPSRPQPAALMLVPNRAKLSKNKELPSETLSKTLKVNPTKPHPVILMELPH